MNPPSFEHETASDSSNKETLAYAQQAINIFNGHTGKDFCRSITDIGRVYCLISCFYFVFDVTQHVCSFAVLKNLLSGFIKQSVKGCSLPDIYRILTSMSGIKKLVCVRSLHP